MREEIINALAKITGLKPESIQLETPEREEFGDYSSNIAMAMFSTIQNPKSKIPNKLKSKIRNQKSSREIAETITDDIRNSKLGIGNYLDKVEVASPGFINFWLKEKLLFNELRNIFEKGERYGSSDTFEDKKIMVEFAHPNTHKELHVGHMRTLILGESLSRIFEALGAKVFRANYQGDVGPHVAKAIWGTQKLIDKRGTTWEEAEKLGISEKARLLGEGYVLGNKDYEQNKSEIDGLNTKIYEKSDDVMQEYERTRKWSLDYYDSFYKRFGVKFDKLYFEREVADRGKEIIKDNLGKVFQKSEGAIIFDGEKYGLHKRVFLTKDGNPTYEAKDMGLAPIQFDDFAFDLNIHVVANEQKGYFEVVFKALELIDENFKGREFHLPMGMVNLVRRKMSSRTGEIYTVDQLLDDVKKEVLPLIKDETLSQEEKDDIAEKVTISAVKYSMLKVNPTMDVSFDLKTSVNIEGNSGPYLQYTFARTQSVLAKFQIQNPKSKNNLEFDIGNLDLKSEELALLRTFIHYPEVIEQAGKNFAPNLLCNYLYELASKYNTFYNMHAILEQRTKDKQQSNFRLLLTKATGQILKNGLDLLGIECPERM